MRSSSVERGKRVRLVWERYRANVIEICEEEKKVIVSLVSETEN